jgi:hypothetical protein
MVWISPNPENHTGTLNTPCKNQITYYNSQRYPLWTKQIGPLRSIKTQHKTLHKKSMFSKKKRDSGDMAKSGLDCIEPWYGNLLSGNFQIQRNPGIKNGQSWVKSLFLKKQVVLKREPKGKG